MHKLMENIKAELRNIGEKGLSANNLDTAGKLVDMYKDLKSVWYMGEEAHEEVAERRTDARFDRNINELYDRYLYCKKEYAAKGTQMYKEKVTKSIDELMAEICDLLFDIHRDCDFREEREIVDRHVKSMGETMK